MPGELRHRVAVLDHPVAHQRPRDVPDVDVGRQRTGDALGHQHILLEQEQIGLQAHVKGAPHGQQLPQQPGEGHPLQRLVDDRLGHRAQRQREGLSRGRTRQVAFFRVTPGEAVIVTFEQEIHQIGEEHPALPVQPPDDTKIDENNLAVGVDEHVARVLITVKEAVFEHRLEETGGGIGQHGFEVVALLTEQVALIDAGAFDPGHNQHPL